VEPPFYRATATQSGLDEFQKRQKPGIPEVSDIRGLEIEADAIVAGTLDYTRDYHPRTFFLDLPLPAIDRSDRLVETHAQLIEPGRHMFFQCCQGQLGTPHAIRIFQTGKG